MNKLNYILFLLLLLAGLNSNAQTNEYLIKAGFIEKFAHFTEWPDLSSENFEIAILGKTPFNNELEKLYSKRLIKDKPIHISYISTISQINNCHILFICESENSQLTNILNFTQNKAILTISESKGFAKKGVLINFYQTNQGTVHFEINPKKVKASGLSIDAMLLDYAVIVN